MKLISFLVTAYNIEEWLLKRCIDSLFAQGLALSDFEVVVVDDGSAQPVEPMLAHYPRANMRIHRQANRGPGGARNTALKLATGKYVLFVDADDYLLADSILSVTSCLTAEAPDILHFGFCHCTGKEPITPEIHPAVCRSYASGPHFMLAHHLVGCNWLYLFQLRLIREYNLVYAEKVLHEDEEFIAKLFYFAGKVVVTNRPVYAYYYRQDSIVHHDSAQQETRRLNDFLEVTKNLQRFAQEQALFASDTQRRALQRKIDFLGVDFLLKIFRTQQPEVYFEQYLPRLREMNLYPLPSRKEGWRYGLFQTLSRRGSGRALLRMMDRYRSKNL